MKTETINALLRLAADVSELSDKKKIVEAVLQNIEQEEAMKSGPASLKDVAHPWPVGSIVKVREDLEAGHFYDGCEFAHQMNLSKGMESVITSNNSGIQKNRYLLENGDVWYFSHSMLELVSLPKEN